MEVMRSSQEALLTIVEVRIRDSCIHTHTNMQTHHNTSYMSCLSFSLVCPLHLHVAVHSCAGPCVQQVLLYDPLFDWTMNPLKAFYLQHDEQQELNATLSSTMNGDDLVNHRKSR